MQEGYLYIIESIKTGRYYIGATINLERRLNEHNRGNNKSTRNRGPWKIIFTKKFENLLKAKQEETKLKKWKNKERINQYINNSGRATRA